MDSLSPHHHLSLFHLLLLLLLLVSSNLLTFFLFSSRSTSCSPSLQTPSILLSSSPPSNPSLPSEFLAFTSPQPLPFGHNHNFDSATLHPPVGLPCPLFPSDLAAFLSYPVNGSCPDDELLAQKLLLRGCEPLPRRRCRPAAPPHPSPPLPLPLSLWSLPPDNSVHWSAYSCKSFACLVDRKHSKSFDDCKDCFDLDGREKHRWVTPSSNPLDFTIDEVLAAANPPGSIRIGLDIGGGSGTFAVRMKERNVTMVTTSMNLNGPFNSFIAARGVVPLYISISQRLPFFDNTLDIVHSMHVLSNWIPTTLLHFVMFDVYRVLRPGGLFWLDHFFFVEEQMEEYVPVIESVGFKKARWEVGRKLDRGPELREMYISALLEKPLNNSW
ncbi:probable methyltransferase At1g29790 [Elaeis guineensis]|uniref:probable methyltransferase At1g29790 n=1 Tax=Elaeis guineensis var. tenera TaxID=51953 RepID=UPI003C6DA423